MIASNYLHARLRIAAIAGSLLMFLTLNWNSISEAQGIDSQKVAPEKTRAGSGEFKPLKTTEIEWNETGFGRIGPVVVGANAKAVSDLDVEAVEQLLRLLDEPDSFVVAHVLLTRLWRVSEKDKERICLPMSTGYFVGYNGLMGRVEWREISGHITKNVTFPDLDQQQKRIAFWWKARYRDFPAEFSPNTVVE